MKIADALPVAFGCLWLAGCATAPPPAPVPSARQQANNMARTATKLTEAENWPAAVRQWEQTALGFAALDEPAHQAVAIHNLAQAQKELEQFRPAESNLTLAAAINVRIGRTNEWWRNQIAGLHLLQENLDEDPAQTNLLIQLAHRFAELSPRAGSLAPNELRGLFFNELGRWQIRQGEVFAASNSLFQAEAAFVKAHDRAGLAAIWANRGGFYGAQAASEAWGNARALYRELGDRRGIALTFLGEGQKLLDDGAFLEVAENCLRQAAQNYGYLRLPLRQTVALRSLVACLQAQKKAATEEQAALAQSHEKCAQRYQASGMPGQAQRHWTASSQIWQALLQSEKSRLSRERAEQCKTAAETAGQ